jgi:hypothetical protein
MAKKTFYATVKIEVESDGELPTEVLEHVATEMDYFFSYDEDGVRIVKTEILETGNKVDNDF